MPADTIVAPATPHGHSALAVVRLSGKLCSVLAQETFQRNSSEIQPKIVTFSQYFSEDGDVLDDVLFVYFQSPASFTGEDSLEIYTHGNPLIVKKIVDDLCRRGCRMADRGEFTRRAFINKKFDLCQAEAVADIIHASNERALKVAQQQMTGQLSDRLYKINDNLLKILALVETNIDFVDEDIDFSVSSSGNLLNLMQRVNSDIQNFLDAHKYRDILNDGVNVVIIGEPNAGKSSLLNVLFGEARALVSDIPGTTRDFISERIQIGNDVLRIVDTAGLRLDPDSQLEKFGIDKTIERAQRADFYLFVVDSSKKIPDLPREVFEKLTPQNCLIIQNKRDLQKHADMSEKFANFDKISVCLNTSDYVEQIRSKISECFSKHHIVPDETTIVVNSRHADVLRRAKELINSAENLVKSSSNSELIASDIRLALETLGEITGAYNTDDMLDKLFSSFCIGK